MAFGLRLVSIFFSFVNVLCGYYLEVSFGTYFLGRDTYIDVFIGRVFGVFEG